MNRIVLIGNGFDMTHGLKTSYNDFIEDIFKQVLSYQSIENKENKLSDDEFLSKCFSTYKSFYFFENIKVNNNEYINFSKTSQHEVRAWNKILNSFILFFYDNHQQRNWNAIEEIYYDFLIKEINNPKQKIENINEDFQVIINLLEKYLTNVFKNTKIESDNNIYNKIYGRLINRDLSTEYKNSKEYLNMDLNSTLFLNFNYTSTEELYSTLGGENTKTIHIHGKLNDKNNPIIFGYGDELDDHYDKLEKSRFPECLDYIKSIKYLETENYRILNNYIEAEEYQVIILGHSCGNTDRTLLNTIFEHKNCISIKPYYHVRDGKDNYSEITKNILRNFNDKKKFRDRVVNKTFCEPLISNTSGNILSSIIE